MSVYREDPVLQHRLTAAAWHDSDWSPLYVYASSGEVVDGLDREIEQCISLAEAAESGLDPDGRYFPRDLDPVEELDRIHALLLHVRRDVGLIRATKVGRAQGVSAAATWEVTTFGHLSRIEVYEIGLYLNGHDEPYDPELLLDVPRSDGRYQRRDVEHGLGWVRPHKAAAGSHERWLADRAAVEEAFSAAFDEGVRDVVAACCQEILVGTARFPRAVPREITELAFARARHQGAFDAQRRSPRPESTFDAELTLATPDEVDPPPADQPSWPLLDNLEPEVRETAQWGTPGGGNPLDVGRSPRLAAIELALRPAWAEGRDMVWQTVVKAEALKVLGRHDEADQLDAIVDTRIDELDQATGPYYLWYTAPYIRPAAPADDASDDESRTSSPEGWIVEPVGEWKGIPPEAVLDPARNEVSITSSENPDLATLPGWTLQATDGARGLWIKDKAAAARAALDRLDQGDGGHRMERRGPDEPGRPDPTVGL